MNNKIKYRIVLDTETCPVDKDFEGVTPSNMWVYDCGWAVVDRNGNVYKTRSFVNDDIFLNEKIAMNSAYYQDKIPKYWDEIKSGERVLTSFVKIRKALLEDIAEFKVTEIYAHNMRFDYGTLNTTQRWLTKSKYRYFFPYDIKICDTLKMSRQVIANKKKYINFCKENNFDLIIDDSINHITKANELNIKTILFNNNNDYKGNQTNNWLELYKIIKELDK